MPIRQIIYCSCFLLFFSATTGFSTPAIFKSKTFYSINGITAEELRQQMNSLGPIVYGAHFDAKTTWHINWQYTWHYNNPTQNPCYLTAANVTVNITMLLPQWLNQDSASPVLKAKWNTYLIALENHEQEHEVNGIKAAEEIDAALSKISPMPTCQALKEAIDKTASDILHRHNIWDKQYDLDTTHGKNQGVIFP
ncbi:DUF922 domain-containing Zn-dependent protease [Legionella cardiaca]|uniref:DUF922 domain-containing protein n=1 Tax=Legionella cardiaca TaxID=1071983 RepID=A0ABY8AQ03_9GAMM|nr:DUF922 domain-containing protein [Legionella cardiaca]WED42311.1 DUF922 domain-containing protein [Legionella cardiaca]